MNSTHAEIAFAVVAVFFIAAVGMSNLQGDSSGLAAQQPNNTGINTTKPYVEMLSPMRNGKIFSPNQEFLFRVKNIDYKTSCQVLVDDQRVGQTNLKPEELATITAQLEPGYHKWKAECKLLNGRTISSQEWPFRVKEPEELTREYKQPSAPAITGQAVKSQSEDSGKGLILALVGIAALVWVANIRRSRE